MSAIQTTMRFFKTPKKVLIKPSEIEFAMEFAQNVVPTVNYRDSNQSNLLKIQDDHFISKIGEEAVKKVFLTYGRTVKGPDYMIYNGKAKSWEEDLYIDEIGLAVKTQKRTSADRYGLSWTFQSSEKRTDPVLKSPLAWVNFVLCNDANGSYSCIVFPPFQVKELVFKKPKLKHLWGKKKVAYYEDLKPKIYIR